MRTWVDKVVDETTKRNAAQDESAPHFAPKAKASRRLVAEAQRGNIEAINRVIELHYEDITYFAMKHVGVQDGEDVAQQAISNIVSKLQDLKDPSKFKSWMMRSVYNECIDYLRKKKRKRENVIEVELDEETMRNLAVESKPMEYEFTRKENVRYLLEMLNKLPQNYADCIRLRYHDDLSNQEIAEVLGISERKVRNDLHRGLKALQKYIEEDGGKPEFFAVGPALIVPLLTEALSAEQAALVTPNVAAHVLAGIQHASEASVGSATLLGQATHAGQIAQGGLHFGISATAKIALVAGAASLTLATGAFFLTQNTNEVFEETPIEEQIKAPDSALLQNPPAQTRSIESVADLIGAGEAEALNSFETQGTNEAAWEAFLSRVGAVNEGNAFEPSHSYEISLVQEQGKQLMLVSKKNTETNNIDVISSFSAQQNLPSMPEVILMFD